jgi:hypothetical protein
MPRALRIATSPSDDMLFHGMRAREGTWINH